MPDDLLMLNAIMPVSKISLYPLLLFFILLAGYLVRINMFSDTSLAEDAHRDYMIARHIALFGEQPTETPRSAPLTALLNNPVYLYIPILLVSIHDSMAFLGRMTILLHIWSLICLFLIGRILFSQRAAFIGVLLYSFSIIGLHQSTFIWAPRMMQPIVYTAYLIALYGIIKGRSIYTYLSIPVFIIAAAIYPAAYSVIPLFIFAIIYTRRTTDSRSRPVMLIPLLIAASYLMLYLPVYFNVFRIQSNHLTAMPALHIPNPQYFVLLFWQNGKVLAETFFSPSEQIPTLKILGFLMTGLLLFLFVSFESQRKKKRLLFCILWILESLFFGAVLGTFDPLAIERHLTPIYGIFALCLGALISSFLSSIRPPRIIAAGVVLLFLSVVSGGRIQQFIHYGIRLPTMNTSDSPATEAVVKRIHDIEEKSTFDSYDFFQIVSYKDKSRYPLADALLWSPLEKRLAKTFTKVSNSDDHNYTALNTDDQCIFVQCILSLEFTETACQSLFTSSYPEHTIDDVIYRDSVRTILVARRGS